MPAHRRQRESGTTALEIAGLTPLVMIVLLALLQVGFTAYAVTAAQTAARQGARADSLNRDGRAAVDAALPSWLDHQASRFGPGHGMEVRVDVPVLVPGLDFSLTRSAVMP